MKRDFQDLNKPLPDGTIPIFTLFDIAVKQIHEGIVFNDPAYCELEDENDEIHCVGYDQDGTRFMMTVWNDCWHITFSANKDRLHINKYPLYQKLFDWGFLAVNI